MSVFVKLAAAAAVAMGFMVGGAVAPVQAATVTTFGFEMFNGDTPALGAQGQLFVDVSHVNGDIHLVFRNAEGGLDPSSVAAVYIEDNTLLTFADLINGPGVMFSDDHVTPVELPGAESIGFSSKLGYQADADAPQSKKGINPGQFLTLVFLGDYDLTIAAILAGDLRFGLQVTSFADGSSSQYISLPHPIPLPAGLVLFLSGLVGIGVLGRYKAKRRKLLTS